MNKPFKGVIYDWQIVGNRVRGRCLFHTTYDNGIADGETITTSDVVRVVQSMNPTVRIVETRNSRYVLV